MKSAPKPSLRTTELARIHADRQSAIIATILQELPDPIPKHCLKLLSHAPESFDDLRYGSVAAAAYNLHLNHRPISILTVQEELARAPARADLTEVFNFLKLRPMPLSAGILEWECEELWHAYSYRQQATVLYEGSQALIASPDQSDSIISHVRRAIDDLSIHQQNGDGLPELIDASEFVSRDIQKPKEVVHGLLYRGSKIGIGGGSKSFKTWNLLNLAISAQAGAPWLVFDTSPSKVLFCNFEIRDFSWQQRIINVAAARKIPLLPGQLTLCNLRGHAADYKSLLPKITAACIRHEFDIVIIDPIYKLYGSAQENNAGDIALLLNTIEELASKSGASVAYGSHFSKGNQSAKDAIDRVSGSGVFARDPDSLVTFTKHEEDGAFTTEFSLREFPPINPFVVRWNFPIMSPDDSLDPSKLKQPKGRKSDHSPDDLLLTLKDQNLTTSDWRKKAEIDAGIKERSFYRLKRALSESNLISQSRVSGCWFTTSNNH
jgi:hypothetical protein